MGKQIKDPKLRELYEKSPTFYGPECLQANKKKSDADKLKQLEKARELYTKAAKFYGHDYITFKKEQNKKILKAFEKARELYKNSAIIYGPDSHQH